LKKVLPLGDYQSVKILGSLCLLDQGELDWKIIGMNSIEAKDRSIKNIEDFNRLCPGALKEIQNWFRTYKTFEGKGENAFGYEGRILSSERTIEIIHDNHLFYRDLVTGKVPNPDKLWLGK
jgi:inorganic pyrophosphatase